MISNEELVTLTLFLNCCSSIDVDSISMAAQGVRALMMMELMMRNVGDPSNLAVARKVYRLSCEILRESQEELSPLLEKYWTMAQEMGDEQ